MTAVDVIVAVDRDAAAARRSLESLLAAPQRTPFEIVVVSDASPDTELVRWLHELSERRRVRLLEQPARQGLAAALNRAVADIPAERMRMHVCWGSTVAPHHTDVPLIDIIDIVLTAKPIAVSFPAANARHEHEWKIWREVKLPAGKAIVPGVIDSTVNTVEHPEVVADRILNFANVVGRENVIAGVDCGFGTFAGRVQVDTKIVWLKLQSLAEGARLASAQLWARAA